MAKLCDISLKSDNDLRQCSSKIYSDEEDIDGMPLVTTEDIDCVPMQSSEKKLRTSHPSGKRSRPVSEARWVRLHLLHRTFHYAKMTIPTTVEAARPTKLVC
ncbi:hypothetical protein quinque_002050 [Culex quinquefasciatus]